MRRTTAVVAAALCAAGSHAIPEAMRAVVAVGKGSNESDYSQLKVVHDQPVPKPGKGQILIRVAASSVNPVDWKLYTLEDMAKMTKDHPKVLGFDVAGVVEALGEGCDRLKPGDAVWADLGKGLLTPEGTQLGAWAEYAVADESQTGLKPEGMSFTDAASLPLVGLTSLQAWRMAGLPAAVRRDFAAVVTSGAAGTGIPAIQMLKAYGAKHIITSASPANIPLLKSLGATDVVDYHQGTIWETLEENSVDVVFDNFGAPGTADAAMKALRPGGAFVFLPGKGGDISKNPKAGVKQFNFGLLDSTKYEDLDLLRTLADGGLKAIAGQSFALEDIVQALQASLSGHGVGKIGVNISTLLAQEILVV